MIRMDRATKLGAGFICLFALPFAGFGLFAFCIAIRHILDGAFQPQTWMLLIFGLVFSGVGFGLIFAMLYGSRLAQREQRKQAEHPAEPHVAWGAKPNGDRAITAYVQAAVASEI